MAIRTTSHEVLTAREARVLGALARALFPRDRSIDVDEDDADVVGRLDTYAQHLPAAQRTNLKALIAGAEVAWMAWYRRPGSIAEAPVATVAEFIDFWSRSDNYTLRQAWFAVKSLLAFAYVESPEVLAAIGAPTRSA